MFTGIVEELGEIIGREAVATGATLTVRGPHVVRDARHGDSIAVNGVCLTVRRADPAAGSFVADVMQETLQRTTLGHLKVGEPANLEPAATLSTRIGGHLVQGHVDGVGKVTRRTGGEREDLTVAVPADVARYLVEKGSVTVDGVSLTVTAVGDDGDQGWFSVSLIPTTLQLTTLGRRVVGDLVNVEVDVVAKYVERLLSRSGHAVREVPA